MLKKKLLIVTCAILIHLQLVAQGVPSSIKTSDAILKDFMDKRFGMFIHWGPVTLRGVDISWTRNREVAQSDYDSLYKEFNPVLFDAYAWVKTAKDAGMKYLTITAKHHDGFCLWPTKYTDYNITKTPYKRDIIGQLANSCQKQGIKFCIYYTILDWYDPNYPIHNDKKGSNPNADMKKFVQYMKNQLTELIVNYHPYMLWFDGNWEAPWTDEMALEIYSHVKKLDPKIIMNNRLGKESHRVVTPKTIGDYATPEQEIGKINMTFPWESCITLGTQWAWRPNDSLKSAAQCINILSRTAGGNGNLLLNVGPMLDGRIEARQVKILKQVGDWLQTNGVAIYGTEGGPYKPDSLFSSTRKGNKLYLHLYANNNGQLILPSIPGLKILKANFIKGSEVRFKEETGKIILMWDKPMPDNTCSIIELEMDGNIDEVPLI